MIFTPQRYVFSVNMPRSCCKISNLSFKYVPGDRSVNCPFITLYCMSCPHNMSQNFNCLCPFEKYAVGSAIVVDDESKIDTSVQDDKDSPLPTYDEARV